MATKKESHDVLLSAPEELVEKVSSEKARYLPFTHFSVAWRGYAEHTIL